MFSIAIIVERRRELMVGHSRTIMFCGNSRILDADVYADAFKHEPT
jgi:hypothetical protein